MDHDKMILRLVSLAGASVATVETVEVSNTNEALEKARAHAEPHGFTNLKLVEEDDGYSWRITAKTPGGRSGRNVAFLD